MFPWLWFWAPQLHLPLSGDVAQRIDPVTHLFFRGIPASAGDARIEEQAFGVASYGRQLGWLTEVLTDLAAQEGLRSPQAREAFARLTEAAARIEALKQAERAQEGDDLEAALRRARARGGPAFEALSERLRPLLEAPTAVAALGTGQRGDATAKG